ncbi:MAG: hypothetical protein Q4D21_03255 [Phascolarctobacterium sp.]|nr:hypothetical protein [Phascolarctobacterium sp.]
MEFGFKFFVFIVFMSLVSFAVAYLAYAMVVKYWGKESSKAKFGQYIIVPAIIVFYNMIIFRSIESGYHWMIGSIPLLLVGGLAIYYYFFENRAIGGEPEEIKYDYYDPKDNPKKRSKKSERIHEARRKRGRE